MSYEDDVRRQMEEAAKDEASGNTCPVDGEVDAAFGFKETKKSYKKYAPKGMTMYRTPSGIGTWRGQKGLGTPGGGKRHGRKKK